ncbi:alkaline phosphatase family protein [Parasediminibacterium paludis]|uniref:Alkaline phosphatase family protein n=1 Tax=Parasediminibacterium paludis TaxID=908966 RepID=A0ABV8Q2B8_9BACT
MKSIIGSLLTLVSFLSCHSSVFAQITNHPQRIVIIMFDGFGEEYYRNSNMPTLNEMERKGLYKVVPSLMPSVTNLNNAAICTGEWPAVNGITGNSFWNEKTHTEDFMEDAALLLSPTLFERASTKGIKSILFASKKKTISLLYKGTSDTISPETASPIWVKRIGTPPSIYSREVNYWLMQSALYTLQHDSTMGIVYIHPTDYPMHTWAPESNESKEYLAKMDSYIQQIKEAAPDAAILITADHTVTHKSLCWDLNKVCAKKNIPITIAISPERDKYFKHHRGFGGTAYVYVTNTKERDKAKAAIAALQGVDEVLTKEEAVKRFHLMGNRIGDLVVLGSKETVFGDLDTESEMLPNTYRSHGSLYDARVPLFVYNAKGAPTADYFKYNYQLASWLFR